MAGPYGPAIFLCGNSETALGIGFCNNAKTTLPLASVQMGPLSVERVL